MKKGFTLVELLAVIVILGLLSVLIVPKVINTLNESEQKTNMASANGLLKAAEYKYQDNEIKGTNQTITIDYTNNINIDKLEYNGKQPEKGKILINSNGKIAMAVKIGDYCYKKELTESEITFKHYNEETCVTKIPTTVTSGDGLYESETEPGRLIYRGTNPNNYINIKEDGTNNILYRIVSYESDGTIKVVRNENLSTKMAWDERDSSDLTTGPRSNTNNTFCYYSEGRYYYYGCNVWGNMNNTYYNGQTLSPEFKYRYYSNNSTETLQEHSNTGTVNTDSTLNQYLNGTWLTSTLSNYIDNHNFNVGGLYYYFTVYTGGDKGIAREKEEEKLYAWTGKVGLLTLTEYVESSTNPSCTDVWSNYYYNPDNETNTTSNEWPCKYDNYNYKSEYNQWFITSEPYYPYTVWMLYTHGYFTTTIAYNVLGVRPAFYLKSTIQIAGQGTTENPYYIVER